MGRQTGLSRRALMARAGALAAMSLMLPACGGIARSRSPWGTNPFTIGVASGDPVSEGAVIWTRLLPFADEPDRTGADPVVIDWRVATDETMATVVQRGTVLALPEDGHSVRVEVRGLQPARPYWYQFSVGGEESPVGRFTTAPLIGAPLARFRMALASCSHYEQGYFAAYRHMVDDAPDVILHVGDYIYESTWGEPVRRHDGPEPTTLDGYRRRYALYRSDPDLKAAHAAAPWLFTWDDHEVDNDYVGDLSEEAGVDPEAFVARRVAAYRACFEHMPLRRAQMLKGLEMRLYQRHIFGDLVDMSILDQRQYRSDQACPNVDYFGGTVIPETCPDLADESRTMLGAAQERFFFGNLSRSRGIWNVMANGVMFARLSQKMADGTPAVWSDAWEGYPAARARILKRVADLKLANFVTLAGDIHSSWVNDLKADWSDPASPTLGSEFVCTSISSAGVPYDRFKAMLPDNPHVQHFESRQRGYTLLTFTPERVTGDMRVIDDVRRPDATVATLASYAVEAGRPGAAPA